MQLSAACGESTENVEPFWTHRFPPDHEFRRWEPGSAFTNYFSLEPARRSLHLTGSLSDDADKISECYRRAAIAVSRSGWGPGLDTSRKRIALECLAAVEPSGGAATRDIIQLIDASADPTKLP